MPAQTSIVWPDHRHGVESTQKQSFDGNLIKVNDSSADADPV